MAKAKKSKIKQREKFRKCAKSGKGKSRSEFKKHMKKCLRK